MTFPWKAMASAGLALLGGCLGQDGEEQGRAMPLKGVTVVAPDAYWQKPAQQPPSAAAWMPSCGRC